MTTVKALTGRAVDTLITVMIRAKNARDYGDYSEVNTVGALIEQEPDSMGTLSFDMTTSTNSQIVLTWSALTGTAKGGSGVSIDNYEVDWYTASTWTPLATVASSTFTYTHTGLTGGTSY